MENKVLFLKLNTKVKLQKEVILLKDIAKLYCGEKKKEEEIKKLEIYRFQKKDKGRCVISILKIISLLQKQYPGIQINSLGETEVIVEKVVSKYLPRWFSALKVMVVSGICFFGTMFTIMAYHNDININTLFERLKEIVGINPKERISALEISYSLGLSLGIIIFYNHLGKRQLTQDPTPIAVEMRTYEEDVNKSLVELAEREGKVIDVV